VHIGTTDVPARVVREGRYAQLRLREPVVAARDDRVVLRTETTVGGGVVLDPAPARRFDPRRLALLERGDPEAILRATVREPVTGSELQARGLLPPGELARGLAALEQAGDWFFASEWLEELRASVRERLAERARSSPLDPGLPLGELLPAEPWAPSVLQLLHVERRDGKAYAPGAAPELGEHEAAAAELESRLAAEDLVRVEEGQLAAFLEARGTLKRVGDGFAVSVQLYERGREQLQRLSPITLGGFRDALGVSRRTAQLLLERYDGDGITRRVGDERRLRTAGRR
jgi:selenocysteine-specific elongation factor